MIWFKITGSEHDLIMKGRKQLEITGVKHVESFDNEEFLRDGDGVLAIEAIICK